MQDRKDAVEDNCLITVILKPNALCIVSVLSLLASRPIQTNPFTYYTDSNEQLNPPLTQNKICKDMCLHLNYRTALFDN